MTHATTADAPPPAAKTGPGPDITPIPALLESEERLRFAVEAGQMAIWEVDLETGAVTHTPELNALFGFPPDHKPSLAELRSRYAPGELEKVGRLGASWEAVKTLVAQGELKPRPLGGGARPEDRTQVEAELTIIVPPGVTRHLLYRAQYVTSLQGRPKITGFLIDITEKRLVEDQLALVAGELRHRVKNSFTVVQALARQSFVPGADVETALKTYLGRLQALSLANDIVLSTEAGAADLGEIVDKITAPYRAGRREAVDFKGPAVEVRGPVVTGFSMALHELCTNALKYGALSSPQGRVHIRWTLGEDGRIDLDWREEGGPAVIAPAREGFGTRLLNRMVCDTLSGSVDLRYLPAGLSCRISARPR
ncbi:MAG: HWE histidine kinase domain-containing protein [Parvibaculaceae bacterium]